MFVLFDGDKLNARLVNSELVTYLAGSDEELAVETEIHFTGGGMVRVAGKLSEVAKKLGINRTSPLRVK